MSMLRKPNGSFVVPAADAEGRQRVYAEMKGPPKLLHSLPAVITAEVTEPFRVYTDSRWTITRVFVKNDGAGGLNLNNADISEDHPIRVRFESREVSGNLERILLAGEALDEDVAANGLWLSCRSSEGANVRYALYGYVEGET